MGQQFWVIRNNPQPGTPAFDAKEKRKADKLARKSGTVVIEEVTDTPSENTPRVQPKRAPRAKRKKK
jgi:YidC/Oxa1 family membrane protein insertase